jgi:hypothetical protein
VGVCSSVIPYVTDQLAMARLSRLQPFRAQPARPVRRHGPHHPVMLEPDESRGQAAAGQRLDDATRRRRVGAQPTAFGRPGQAVQALGGQQVQVPGRDPVSGVDRHGRGKEHVIGDPCGQVAKRC